jgi:hypothetical protein
VPASSTGWTVSNLSGQVVNAAVLVVGLVLASRRPENRIGPSWSHPRLPNRAVNLPPGVCPVADERELPAG